VADDSEPGTEHDIRGQSEIHQVENIEKLDAELQLDRFMRKRCLLDH